MPLAAATLDFLEGALVGQAGGYLRNAVHHPRVTCAVCAVPCTGHLRCATCLTQARLPGPRADQVATLIYGMAGRQSGYLMRGYKAQPRPVAEHRRVVAMIAMLGLGWHTSCAASRPGRPVTHWAVVPSLPAKSGDHPLRRLVAPAAHGVEVTLTAATAIADPRAVSGDHFVADPVPPGSHVLLLDDTWTSGGHAQSAVLALRSAGAAAVSLMVVARWILPGAKGNGAFLRERATADYDPRQCPWDSG